MLEIHHTWILKVFLIASLWIFRNGHWVAWTYSFWVAWSVLKGLRSWYAKNETRITNLTHKLWLEISRQFSFFRRILNSCTVESTQVLSFQPKPLYFKIDGDVQGQIQRSSFDPETMSSLDSYCRTWSKVAQVGNSGLAQDSWVDSNVHELTLPRTINYHKLLMTPWEF